MSWYPAYDAARLSINYTISTTMKGMNINHSTSVEHPITTATFTGLPLYSAGTVTVQARNPGAVSEPVSLDFKMVDIGADPAGKSRFAYY